MKNAMVFKAIKNMMFTLSLLLPFQFGTGMTRVDKIDEATSMNRHVILLDLNSEYCDIACFLAQNAETVSFLSKTFAIDSKDVVDDLVSRNANVNYDIYNIGRLTDKNGNYLEYDSFEKGFIEYLYVFARENPNLVDNHRVPYNGNADYIIDLISYFTSIYDNVDYLTAVSIGAAESGYYRVTYMLNCNNVFGGMSNSGLIKYKNIEYGILSFIRLLSYNYYGRGLDNLYSIGKVYCPTFDENGNKVASQHWINLVNKAMNYYKDSHKEVAVSNLINN